MDKNPADKNPFEALVSLVDLDHAITQLVHEKNEIESVILRSQQTLALAEQEYAQLLARGKEQKVAARLLEQDIARLDTSMQKKQQQIGTSRSTKEEAFLRDEIAFLDAERMRLDEQLFVLWEEIEKGERFLYSLYERLEETQKTTQKACAEHVRAQERIQEHIADLQKQRTSLELLVNQDVLHEYEHMRKTVENPIVFVDGTTCPVCFYSLSANQQAIIHRQARVICSHCYRFLYKRRM